MSPYEKASRGLLKDHLMEALQTLTHREQLVIRLRFGLDDDQSCTLEEVGRIIRVTRERVCQIDAYAKRQLREPRRSIRLRDWLEE